MSANVERATNSIHVHEDQLIRVSDQIWDLAEIKFEEWQSAALLCEELEKEGFRVERDYVGLPTAFRASFGSGVPVIGFLGEYDALPNLSQVYGTAGKKARDNASGNGHGCGHHLLGTALMGAAIALREYLQETGKSGTVVFYGCPAEEGGSGKAWMCARGAFDEADALFSWHPDSVSRVRPNDLLATMTLRYDFHGVAAHAAAAPQFGRSALEAVELMNVGMGFLREHIPQDARVHYAIANSGGAATNIIQPEASVVYQIRAPRVSDVQVMAERIGDLARGAAIMTGTSVDTHFVTGAADLQVSETLNDLLYDALVEVGAPRANAEDLTFAAALYETLPERSRGSTAAKAVDAYAAEGAQLAKDLADGPLVNVVYPRRAAVHQYSGSSDVGDVSQVKPVGFLDMACFVKDIPLHTWQTVAFGKSHFAHEGMLHAARILGAAAIRLLDEPEAMARAQAEWAERAEQHPYSSLIPAGANPPIRERKG